MKRVNLFFQNPVPAQMKAEAKRQDRTIAWIAQWSWRIAREQIMNFDPKRTGK